jgi:hypothetical protein
MIESMFVGIFAGMLSCTIAILINYKLSPDQDVDIDQSKSFAKTSLYLLTTLVICLCAAFDLTIGALAISVYTLFGMFTFIIADECINSSLFGRLVGETE